MRALHLSHMWHLAVVDMIFADLFSIHANVSAKNCPSVLK